MKFKFCFLFIIVAFFNAEAQQQIDRKAVVTRHNVAVIQPDSLTSLTVGNGVFAFTVDVTGLQSFPMFYNKGVALGTQAEWGWHSFPNKEALEENEFLKKMAFNGNEVPYAVQWNAPERNKRAANYFRQNPHRLQLGNVGLEFIKKGGQRAGINDLKKVDQTLNLWTGEIKSRFVLEDVPVEVITCAHHEKDAVGAKITSPLIAQGRLKVFIQLPYPTGEFSDAGTNYADDEKHLSSIINNAVSGASLKHTIDTTNYYLHAAWSKGGSISKSGTHFFNIHPPKSTTTFQFAIQFSPKEKETPLAFSLIKKSSLQGWERFWQSGGAVDFGESTNKNAKELERRMVLSQYLTRVQCAGNYPPQETGLTYNSWYGKPHLEMYWWHAAHYALWNRTELLEKSMQWFFDAIDKAQNIAARQGYKGARWQKMTDREGRETPSSVGAFLIWQQPHIIYLAEAVYRNKKETGILKKYKDLIFETADFMASYPYFDKEKNQFNLGKGLIPAQECFNPDSTYNPTYELAYWHWGLSVAQQWRERLGLERKKEWDEVLSKLAPLPQKNGVYLATESTPDCYDADSKYLIDHPAVLGAYSTLPPANGLDTAIMSNTFDLVWKVWNWDHTWGWDFPLTAMAAARLGKRQKAIDALMMPVKTNTYLLNGHNYQDERLTIYLPGNGGLLAAIAMMCAGWDNTKSAQNPGFPQDGSWKVKWEGLQKMP